MALTPITPLAIGGAIIGLGQFKPARGVPDLAMLMDVRRELHLGSQGA